ncbi:MAG TPA: hypothetical protein VM221_09315 [Armatimonadota bacterium]|nr:hypothetical protein [Armatimonadota bacterium]
MALTPGQQAKLNALKLAFHDVWQKALIGLEFCNRVQDRADDADLNLTDAQKLGLLTRIAAMIDAVDAANTTLKGLK